MSYHVHKLKPDMSYDLTVTAHRQLAGQTTFSANDIPTQSSPMWVNSDFTTTPLPLSDWPNTAPQATVESTSEITEAVNSVVPTEPTLVNDTTDSLSESPHFEWLTTPPQTTVESTAEITEAVNSVVPTEPTLVNDTSDSLSDLPHFEWLTTPPQTTVESTADITEAVNSVVPTEPTLVTDNTDSLSDSFENSSQAINMTYNEGTLIVEVCVRYMRTASLEDAISSYTFL